MRVSTEFRKIKSLEINGKFENGCSHANNMEIAELSSYSVLHAIRLITMLAVLIKFMIQSSKYESNKSTSKSTLSKDFKFLKNTTLINILSLLCAAICTSVVFTTRSVYYYVDNVIVGSYDWNYGILKYTQILEFTFYGINLISLELFLLCQLHTTFEKTTYAITRNILKILSICIVCHAMFIVIGLVISAVELGDHSWIFLGISIFTTIILSSIISFMFSNRLFTLMINLRQSIINNDLNNKSVSPSPSIVPVPSVSSINDSININIQSNYDNNSDINISLSDKQVKLLKTITKHTVLILFITVMLCSYFICHSILYQFEIDNEIIVVFLWYIIDGSTLTIPICLWLSFIFGKKEYNFLCSQCHSCCFRCFEYFAMKKLEKKYSANDNNVIDLQVEHDKKNDNHLVPY